MQQVQYATGQMAALETMVHALFLAHPNKEAVREFFTERSAATTTLIADAPQPFRDGYRDRSSAISQVYLGTGAPREVPPPQKH